MSKIRNSRWYFALWFPLICICITGTLTLLTFWITAPRVPSRGMEALVGVFYVIFSAWYLPFCIGLPILAWLHPRKNSIQRIIVVPTVILTACGFLAFYLVPRPKDDSYPIRVCFFDSLGNHISNVSIEARWQTPSFPPQADRRELITVTSDNYTFQKKKIETLELRLEKDGYYYLQVQIPQWFKVADPNYVHSISLTWQKKWSEGKWGVDACNTAITWQPRGGPLSLIFLRLDEPAKVPEYKK